MSEITPVPSATVTLVRDSNGGVEVLMMQRRLKSVFVPGMYVFPGGAVDDQDHAPALYELCAQVSDQQASETLGIERGGLDYWVAAIRESFEEAGLLVDGTLRGCFSAKQPSSSQNGECEDRYEPTPAGLSGGSLHAD